MRRILAVGMAMVLTAVSPAISAAGEPQVSAQAAALIEAESGRTVFAKNETEQLSMASTTKIMTALLTLEEIEASGDREVTITDEMVRVEGSSMGLLPGCRLTLHDLAVGMLTVSGNDAANSAAYAIDGALSAFADRMNRRAETLGLENTHFVMPSGLDADGHYSTALDMARLGAAAISNPEFRSICSQRQMTVSFAYPEQTYHLTNHNKMLSLYDGCIGIKTGYTKKSGRCLVTAAERDGILLVAATLNAPDDWNDHQAMLDYGFSQIETFSPDDSGEIWTLPVVGGVVEEITAVGQKAGRVTLQIGEEAQIARTVKLPRFLYAPVQTGEQVGEVEYSLNGEALLTVPILARENVTAQEVEKGWLDGILDWISSLLGRIQGK